MDYWFWVFGFRFLDLGLWFSVLASISPVFVVRSKTQDQRPNEIQTGLIKKTIDVLLRIEDHEVVEFLADARISNRQA